MRGVYALILTVPRSQTVIIGSLGSVFIEMGSWVYVGSAMGTTSTCLESRIKRHLSKQKKVRWHIDYILMTIALIDEVVWAESHFNMECIIIRKLLSSGRFTPGPNGFGASDCKSNCTSHLMRYMPSGTIVDDVMTCMQETNLKPYLLNDILGAS